jgi:DNA-binding MarR family transcriptional regulator
VNLANDLNSSAIHLLRRISQDDAADGITAARASALSVLVYGGATTLGELARRERVATPTMSRLIAAMVDEGLVTRTPVAGNRRAVTLQPTPRGRELMERGRSRRIARLSAELAALTADEIAALERANEVLARLAQARPPATTKRAARRSTHPSKEPRR